VGDADGAPAGGDIDGIRIAVAQVGAIVGEPSRNLATVRRYADRAARAGADLVIFPECFAQGYSLRPAVLGLAEELDGPIATTLGEIARRAHVALIVGFIERNPGRPDRPFNTALVVGRDGGRLGAYRKTHLFDGEHGAFAPGDRYPVIPVPLRADRPPLRVGVAICADIEYPEVARLLCLGGADLIAVPSADMEPYRVQQAANLMSRAIENNVHVALANTVERRATVTFFGGSGIAAPDGTLVSAGYDRPRLIIATLSAAAVERSGGPGSYLRSRRIETYADLLATPPAGT